MDAARLLAELGQLENTVKLTGSAPERKGGEAPDKFTLRPVELRGQRMWQLESFADKKAFHENLDTDGALRRLEELLPHYRQLCAVLPGETVTYSQYGKKLRRSRVPNDLSAPAPRAHDREKSYLLPEGEAVPALVDLGIFTEDYRIIHARYDKYKQINRFLELVDDELRHFSGDHIRIMDFGCGKSYLTFILYYYLTVKRGLRSEIIGYDLKADVVERCNAIAGRYGYDTLRFVQGDVSRDTADGQDVDMLVTLHACDTATDYALDYAIRNRIPHILSVPCCQHEVNLSLRKGGELDIFQKHGIIKERMSALLTDALRAELMERCGSEVDVIEFVDLSHTPKNLMLRCRLRRSETPALGDLQLMQRRYGFSQTLLRLCCERAAGAGKAATYGDRGN